jgi:hypothetical protein
LAEGSLCIDAGNASLAPNISLDLSGQNRISGAQIDMGAYEFEIATAISTPSQEAGRSIQFKDGKIQIAGAKENDILRIYNINGTLVYQSKINAGKEFIQWNGKGLHLIKLENQVYKLFIQ